MVVLLLWKSILYQSVGKKYTVVKLSQIASLPSLEEQFPKQEKKPKTQIVNNEFVNIVKNTPKDAKFLSEHNQMVKEEQKSAIVDIFKQTQNDSGGDPRPKGPEKADRAEKKAAQKSVDQISLADLGRLDMTNFKRSMAKEVERNPTAINSEAASAGGSGMDAQKPGETAANNDYLPDVKKQGVQTLLNSREFVYFSYFKRIRERLEMFWGPKIREKVERISATGKHLSGTDKITGVTVALNSQGRIVKVDLIERSGVREIDDAAVEAFNKAGPFPNPPQGLMEADGLIRVRWDFVLHPA